MSGPQTNASRANRVLLVEDETSISEPLAKALRRAGFEPLVASTAAEAVDRFGQSSPDMVLLDLMLPDGDGLDVARAIRRTSETPIIILSARGEEADRVIGLELGADDYVVKPFSSAEVVARIRAVLRRVAPDGPEKSDEPVAIGELELDARARRAALGGRELELTRKEFDLLALLVANAGSVVERERIMSEVWDENWFGPTKTLDVHVSALRRKLGDDPGRPRYLHTVRGVGFRFSAPGEMG